MTNFEKIKKKLIKQIEKMDIYEFASYIMYPHGVVSNCNFCIAKKDSKKCFKTNCFDGIREYLEREGKNEQTTKTSSNT